MSKRWKEKRETKLKQLADEPATLFQLVWYAVVQIHTTHCGDPTEETHLYNNVQHCTSKLMDLKIIDILIQRTVPFKEPAHLFMQFAKVMPCLM